MELQQLRYFKALAENGNLTKTAERLHVTPPTLSNSISRLESDLGVQLFDRRKGRLYLNEAGKLFLESSNTVINVLDLSCDNVRNVGIHGKKTLSVSTSVSSFILFDVFAHYLELHPDVRLVNRQSNVQSIETDLSENHFGLAITIDGTLDGRQLNSRLLSPETKTFSVGMSKDHPLAKKEAISILDLKNEKFVFPPSDLPLTKSFYSACRNAGFEPDVIAECNTFLLTNFVEKGFGVTFVTSKEFFDHATIKYVPVYDVKNFIQDRLSIYWTKKHQLSDVEKDFLEFISDYFKR